MRQRIEDGEAFDLAITNPEMVEALVASGKVAAGSQVAFGRIAMGVAARAGSPPLDLSSRRGFEDVLKAAGSIAYASEGSSGAYFMQSLERLGIAGEVGPRLVAVSGGQTAAAVGRGEAMLGIVPVTSILAAGPDVVLAGRFPAELQSYIDFDLGIGAASRSAEVAGRLAAFLRSAAVDGVLAARGVERRHA